MRLSPSLFWLCETFFRNFSKVFKGPPSIFSLRLFFGKFLDCTKRYPLVCFDILQRNGCQNPKESPFYIFRHCDTSKVSFFDFFSKFFQSLQMVPTSIFFLFSDKLDFQKAQLVLPSTVLKTSRFLSLRYSANFRHSLLVQTSKRV